MERLMGKKRMIAIILALAAVLLVFLVSGCGGGGSDPVVANLSGGTAPTGIPGQPTLNTILPAYASSTADLFTSWSVDGYSKDCYVNGVQVAGPNNTATTLTITNALTEGNNVFSMLCKNSAGTSGPTKDYSIIKDTTAPGAPVLAVAVPTTTSAATTTIYIEKSYDWMVESRVNSGAWAQALQQDAFTNSNFDTKVVRSYDQGLVSGLNTIQIRATDRASNVGTSYLTVSVTSSATGGGTTNPSAPTISCSHSTNALILTSVCTISGTGCISASMSWGDGTTNANITCAGSTISHTYASAGAYSTVATVSSAGGSNTYTQSVTVSGGTGGGGYTFSNTSWNTVADDLASDGATGTTYLYALNTANKCITRYTTSGGDGTNWCGQIGGAPESLDTPVGIAWCPNGRLAVLDRGRNKVYLYTISTMTYYGSFSYSWNVASGIGCDTSNNIYVSQIGNQVFKFDSTGANQWSYTGNLSSPKDIAADSNGNVYITDTGNFRIVKLNSSGAPMTTWSFGLSNPTKIHVFGDKIIISDTGNSRIRVINTTGTDLGAFGSSGTGNGQLTNVGGLTTIGATIFAADATRIQTANPN